MTPEPFILQHSDVKQPTLLDEEITTTDWPMPPVKAWEPVAQSAYRRWYEDRIDAVRRLGV